MLILGIDTSNKMGGIALYHSEEGLISELSLQVRLNHSDTLMETIDTVFKFTSYKIKDIDKVVVGKGPGSFTGIRVGMATAKGLAFALGKEIVGINSLDIVANMGENKDVLICPMIDARKERVYYAKYRNINNNLSRESDYLDGDLNEILPELKDERILFLGDGAINNKALIEKIMGENALFNKEPLMQTRAAIIAWMGIDADSDNIYTLEPEYISKSQAERMKK